MSPVYTGIVLREKGETEWLLLHLAQVCWACSVCYHILGGIRKEECCVPFACKGRVKEQKVCTTTLGSMSLGLFGGGLWVSASLACNAASARVWKAVSRTLALSQLGPSNLSLCQLLLLACKRRIPVGQRRVPSKGWGQMQSPRSVRIPIGMSEWAVEMQGGRHWRAHLAQFLPGMCLIMWVVGTWIRTPPPASQACVLPHSCLREPGMSWVLDQ